MLTAVTTTLESTLQAIRGQLPMNEWAHWKHRAAALQAILIKTSRNLASQSALDDFAAGQHICLLDKVSTFELRTQGTCIVQAIIPNHTK